MKREAVECTFTPTRISSERSGRYLQNSSNSLMSPENYKPLVAERRRKDELLRCQIAQRDAVELTFQPKINSRKSRVAISNRRTSATERQRADSANKSTRVDVQSEHSVSAVEGLAGPNPTQLENDDLHPNEIGGKEGDGCHERLYQLGLNRLSRLDEVHQVSLNNGQHLYWLWLCVIIVQIYGLDSLHCSIFLRIFLSIAIYHALLSYLLAQTYFVLLFCSTERVQSRPSCHLNCLVHPTCYLWTVVQRRPDETGRHHANDWSKHQCSVQSTTGKRSDVLSLLYS